LHRTLVDPQLTSIRLGLNPEKMVVAEAQRTYTYLSLFGYPTDLVWLIASCRVRSWTLISPHGRTRRLPSFKGFGRVSNRSR